MSFFMLSPLHRRRPLYSNCTSRSGRPLGGVNHILCGVHEQRAVADKSTRRLSVFFDSTHRDVSVAHSRQCRGGLQRVTNSRAENHFSTVCDLRDSHSNP